MRAPTDKDYTDARDAALMSALQEYSAKVDTRLAEMETRVLRALNDMQRWVAGIVLAGVTVSTSVTAYMLTKVLTPLNQLQADVRRIQQTQSAPIPTPAPAAAPATAPIIIYALPPQASSK